MYKSIVNELALCETIEIKVRSSEGAEIVLQVRSEEKFSKLKEEIWKNIGVKTQLKIGDAIVDIMTEYIQSTELSYDAFGALPEAEQVKLMARSGRYYEKFWQHYIALFDGLVIEEEANLMGLGMTSGDEIALMPRLILARKENLFLQLCIGVRRKKTELGIGINNMVGMEHDCSVRDREKKFHTHNEDLVAWDQCEYELRLLETILMPTLDRIMSGDKEELPEKLPPLENIRTLLRMKYYRHSWDALKDIHDLVANYRCNINIMLNFNDSTEEVKYEADKREAILYSVNELLNKFESTVTNSEEVEYIFPTIFVGPSRSFNQYNYTVALPCIKLNRITATTTVEDLIESYKHFSGQPDMNIASLFYDGVEYLPYVLIKKIFHKKLIKHFFYFHHANPEDARTIDELLNFIGGEQSTSNNANALVPSTPKIRKKRRKNRPSVTQLTQNRSDSISEDVSVAEASSSDIPSILGATALEAASSEAAPEAAEAPFKLEKSSTTEQMKKIWQEYSDRNQGQRQVFEASREFDFDITEEEGGPHDMTLEKADYLDKLTNMIAAKAQAEWENKMKGFEKLQEENEELQKNIRDKEKEFDGHKEKVTEMIDNQAKAMTNYISVISKTEDEKAENVKEIKKLDQDIVDLEAQIGKIKEKQRELDGKCGQCDAQIEKMERKRKKLEKYMEAEMGKVKAEGSAINEDIERLNEALRSNIKATEDLARMDIVRTETAAGAEGAGGKTKVVSDGTSRMLDFLSKSIKEKEADLECPVCMETAEIPIFMCQEMHLICALCRPKVRECPECRVPYQGQPRRHRYAEKTAEELKKLKEEFTQLTA